MKIEEISHIKVYHGDNHNTTKLDPILMNNGNNQEGIGIYFSSKIETAKYYGSNIVAVEIDTSRFVNSRMEIGKAISIKTISDILLDMLDSNLEEMYYIVTDYGVEVSKPEDIRSKHILMLSKLLVGEQVRNFQIDLADKFGVVEFVKSWNKHTSIDGTYNKNTDDELWFAIINNNIPITKIEG